MSLLFSSGNIDQLALMGGKTGLNYVLGYMPNPALSYMASTLGRLATGKVPAPSPLSQFSVQMGSSPIGSIGQTAGQIVGVLTKVGSGVASVFGFAGQVLGNILQGIFSLGEEGKYAQRERGSRVEFLVETARQRKGQIEKKRVKPLPRLKDQILWPSPDDVMKAITYLSEEEKEELEKGYYGYSLKNELGGPA